jgi:hypothetical protein
VRTYRETVAARCLAPGGTVEQRLQRGLECGTITEGDAVEVRTFVDYLRDQKAHPDEPLGAVYARHYPDTEQ